MSWLLNFGNRRSEATLHVRCCRSARWITGGTLLVVLCFNASVLAGTPKTANTTKESDKQFNKLLAEVKAKVGGEQTLNQYKSKFMGLSRNELRFMHEVCKLRRSQFDAIKTDVDRTALRIALDAASTELAMNRGGGRRAQRKTPDVYKKLEDGLMRAAKTHLTEVQARAYCEELEARRQFRKEADAGMLLGFMDPELRLTDEQRNKLLPHLVKAWTPDWEQNLSIMEGNGLRFMPQIPNQEFRKLLNEKQKEIFSTFGQSGTIFFGMHVHQFPDVDLNAKPLADELLFEPEVEEGIQ